MLVAIYRGGDQVKSHRPALRRAAEISALVYGEQDASYWEKYYTIQRERDAQGLTVELGGSAANNVQDALHLFGLGQYKQNLFARTYNEFGDRVVRYYPQVMEKYQPVDQVVNTAYLEEAARKIGTSGGSASLPTFTPNARITTEAGRKAWSITLESGSSRFTPEARRTLDELFGELSGHALLIKIEGHTDDVGDETANIALSRERAEAVRNWLMGQDPTNFPVGRFTDVRGYGESSPVGDNATEAGRRTNRRVEVIVGSGSR
jgi:outer membrane protein OmpA-like peptidoglycan-associated protein